MALLDSKRRDPSQFNRDRFVEPVCRLRESAPQPRTRERDPNDSGGIWQAVYRQLDPPDPQNGPWAPFGEEQSIALDPMTARCRRYVPEPVVEKDVEFRTCRLRKIVPPEQASLRPSFLLS
eukprot:TRINITY_DN19904_c0_g1_i2.p1 TRINITY_DN19904_c0_g1~~TRINITY_DN19904_c0_g1_i2.p1  ORF type:complete len:130 (-),score=13.29 TRINITY_DN19904_c0_g1_i2:288-650(-)